MNKKRIILTLVAIFSLTFPVAFKTNTKENQTKIVIVQNAMASIKDHSGVIKKIRHKSPSNKEGFEFNAHELVKN